MSGERNKWRACASALLAGVLALSWSACGSDGVITVVSIKTPSPALVGTPTPPPRPSVTLTPVRTPTTAQSPTPTPTPSNCCREHPGASCEFQACETCVCDADGFCCGDSNPDNVWDASCVDIAGIECNDICRCGP
jgi:hypothetical protein